jgi:hypothetical protein
VTTRFSWQSHESILVSLCWAMSRNGGSYHEHVPACALPACRSKHMHAHRQPTRFTRLICESIHSREPVSIAPGDRFQQARARELLFWTPIYADSCDRMFSAQCATKPIAPAKSSEPSKEGAGQMNQPRTYQYLFSGFGCRCGLREDTRMSTLTGVTREYR